MNKRNYGIDLLRMLLMFMVVILHVLGKGGILDSTSMRTANYYLAWVLECACLCAANCYALITGYVHYEKNYKLSPLLTIMLQTLFYSITISLLFWVFSMEDISMDALLNTFFPVFRRTHWFVSAYAGMFILMPILDTAAQKLTTQQTKFFLSASFLAFSIVPTFLLADPFSHHNGYSAFWLSYLYLIGAFIRKYQWEKLLSVKKCFILYFVCALITAVPKLLIVWIPLFERIDTNIEDILISYTSPTVFIAGIALFLVFLQTHPKPVICKLLTAFSPAAFGVYLIHCHPYIFSRLTGIFSFLAERSSLLMIFDILTAALVIYLPCLLLDLFRAKLFRKMRIKELFAKVDAKLLTTEPIKSEK